MRPCTATASRWRAGLAGWCGLAAWLSLALGAGTPAWADDAGPHATVRQTDLGGHDHHSSPGPGWRLTWDHAHLRAPQPLPSQALPGYLLQGDAGNELRGTGLVHAAIGGTVQAGDGWLLHGQIAQHGRDAPHTEALWARRALYAVARTTLTVGRQAPAQGALWTHAGHHDRFRLMPMAKQASTLGTWRDDGAQLRWQSSWDTPAGMLQQQVHIGLWQGHAFPGSRSTSGVPSLHTGAAVDHASGLWRLDAWAASARVSDRGARLNLAGRGHSHVPPQCDAQLSNVVCFNGRSTLSGWSLGWHGPEGLRPLAGPTLLDAERWQVDVGQLWRHEAGQLASANGDVALHSRYAGQLLQAWWTGDAIELGWRAERLMARHRLVGPGAAAVAQDAGLVAYAPVQRQVAALAWPVPAAWLGEGDGHVGAGLLGTFGQAVRLSIESGHERQGDQRLRFTTVRLVIGASDPW